MLDDARETPSRPKPTLYLNEEDLPDIGDVSVGDRISLHISAKVKSISQEEKEKGKQSFNYTLEITSANVEGNTLKKTSNGFGQALQGRLVK